MTSATADLGPNGPMRRAVSMARTAFNHRGFILRTMGYCTTSVVLRPFTGERVPQRLMRTYFESALDQLGIDIEAEGLENLRDTSPSIICVNHNSLLDIPCVGVLLDFDYKWVSKKEIFSIPFIGWHLRACGHMWVDRSRRDNSERLALGFHSAIERGGSILMFPEGTRSTDGRLQKFRRGAFVTAVSENTPVLPIVVNGTEKLLEKGSVSLGKRHRQTVQVRVLERIPVPSPTAEFGQRVSELCATTRAAMVRALDSVRGEVGAAERPTLRAATT